MKFCEKLKQLRTGKGWTQEKLAKELYVSRSAVAKWEQGRGYPSFELIERLSDIFEFSIDDLLSEKEYRMMTIETNIKSKRQKNYNKIIGIISSFQNIKTENVARGDSIAIMYMTQDETRYSVIYMYDSRGKKTIVLGYGTKIFRGEEVAIPRENYYGFKVSAEFYFADQIDNKNALFFMLKRGVFYFIY